MSLPDLIEIVPLDGPRNAVVTVPGSKSITNRALILAALAEGTTELRGALWSEDTQIMVDCLGRMGFALEVEADPNEVCNRIIRVNGCGGEIPYSGTVELQVGNAGTAARFLSALVCLGSATYHLSGTARMHERPQAALFKALRELGYRVESANDKLPAVIHGGGVRKATCHVAIDESSQFASALILCAGRAGWNVKVAGFNPEESPYVVMTQELTKAFPGRGGVFEVEPDASSGSYFWGAGHVMGKMFGAAGPVTVAHWPASGWQIDAEFPKFLPLPENVSRERDLGDSIMTGITLAVLGEHPVKFNDLGRLRVQECERVTALRTELMKCGVKVVETGDTLEVFPGTFKGAEIATYSDHRMAMCFAILGLKGAGMRLQNPACVKKTFPNFFQKLAASVPQGLGVEIRDGRTGRKLEGMDLFAD